MPIDDTDDTDVSFETIEHTDDAEFPEDITPEMRGWYICLHTADGETYDEIGPFDTKEEAEAAQDIMDFDVAA